MGYIWIECDIWGFQNGISSYHPIELSYTKKILFQHRMKQAVHAKAKLFMSDWVNSGKKLLGDFNWSGHKP